MDYVTIVQNMASSIIESVKNYIDEKAPADRTYRAQITAKLSDYRYKAKINGSEKRVSSTKACSVGDMVRVCVPRNDWNDIFVIENMTTGK